MKRFPYLLTSLFLFTIVIASCSSADGYSYNTAVDKIKGKWTIDKVHMENNDKFFETDITASHEGMTFDFKNGNLLEIYDAREDKTFPGVWYLDEIWTWDDDDQEDKKSFELYTYVYNPDDTTQYREMTWRDLKLNNNRLFGRTNRYADDGIYHKYTYKLTK